jgi:hypothetical protein
MFSGLQREPFSTTVCVGGRALIRRGERGQSRSHGGVSAGLADDPAHISTRLMRGESRTAALDGILPAAVWAWTEAGKLVWTDVFADRLLALFALPTLILVAAALGVREQVRGLHERRAVGADEAAAHRRRVA